MSLLSLAHLTLLDVAPPELVSVAARAGFDAVGIRLGRGAQPTDPDWPMLGDTPMRRETRQLLSETGLQVLEVEGVSILPGRSVADLKRLDALLESASVLGARFLTVATFATDQTHAADELALICARTAPYGVAPVLEFFARSGAAGLDDAAQLVAQPGCERAGILMDTLHLFRTGGSPADLDCDRANRVTLIQLCDAPREQPRGDAEQRAESRNRRLPGEGELPLREVLSRLPAGLPISVEAPSARLIGVPSSERAQLACAAARRVLDSCIQVCQNVDCQ